MVLIVELLVEAVLFLFDREVCFSLNGKGKSEPSGVVLICTLHCINPGRISPWYDGTIETSCM